MERKPFTIATKTGDDGTTSLGDGTRVSKDDLRIETNGTIDELNSYLGVVIAHKHLPENVKNILLQTQQKLSDLCAEISTPTLTKITTSQLDSLEKTLHDFEATLPPLDSFIAPGGTKAAAHCHVARTICRRAERRMIALAKLDSINPITIQYLNRLSDLLFVLARKL